MTNIHKRFPKQSTWGDFSNRLCKFYRLPHGSKFILARQSRCVRGDKVVARKAISLAVLSRDEDQTVREILNDVEAMLATRPRDHGWELEARDPSDVTIPGQTRLKAWQARQPAPTEAEREARRVRREEIDLLLRPLIANWLEEAEEGLDDPGTKVPQAALAELVERYGLDAARAAITELRL